jgi:hypothetical protein
LHDENGFGTENTRFRGFFAESGTFFAELRTVSVKYTRHAIGNRNPAVEGVIVIYRNISQIAIFVCSFYLRRESLQTANG